MTRVQFITQLQVEAKFHDTNLRLITKFIKKAAECSDDRLPMIMVEYLSKKNRLLCEYTKQEDTEYEGERKELIFTNWGKMKMKKSKLTGFAAYLSGQSIDKCFSEDQRKLWKERIEVEISDSLDHPIIDMARALDKVKQHQVIYEAKKRLRSRLPIINTVQRAVSSYLKTNSGQFPELSAVLAIGVLQIGSATDNERDLQRAIGLARMLLNTSRKKTKREAGHE